ncbi:MAG TPA: hypothetical protein VKU40_09575, partial [Thermoanaerobaculia bacterium]|nr:hypothetical protein [Thermoanaerobaculia bacterium]
MPGAPSDVPAVYALADAAALGGLDRVPAAVAAMAAAGVGWIQLRLKPRRERADGAATDAELYRTVEASVAAAAAS